MKKITYISILALFTIITMMLLINCKKNGIDDGDDNEEPKNVLIFSKTGAFRHEAIEPGGTALKEYLSKEGIEAFQTEDATLISSDGLKTYDVLIFFLTTGNVLDSIQEEAVQKFISKGRGFVGIHSAADTEYGWPWFGDLVGARFANHPGIQQATFVKMDTAHQSVKHLPERWARTDEIYNYVETPSNVHVVLSVDESTYSGGTHGDNHPVSWYRDYFGGRSFYTSMGHTVESYQDTMFLKHLVEGIKWAGRFD